MTPAALLVDNDRARHMLPALTAWAGDRAALLTGMDVSIVVGLRVRAVIAVMTYTFARVGAVVALTVEDYYPQKKGAGTGFIDFRWRGRYG